MQFLSYFCARGYMYNSKSKMPTWNSLYYNEYSQKYLAAAAISSVYIGLNFEQFEYLS